MYTINFRLDAEKKKALDAIAAGLGRDRSYVLNEAIDSYLEVHRWQIEHIKEGVRQAKAGKFSTENEVKAGEKSPIAAHEQNKVDFLLLMTKMKWAFKHS